MQRARTPWFFAAALWLAGSWAHAAYLLESAPVSTRQAAEAQLQRVEAALSPPERAGLVLRVVRRYVRGVGWRYYVAIEEIPDADRLRRAAKVMATQGASPTAYEASGVERRPVALDAPPASGAPPAPAPTPAARAPRGPVAVATPPASPQGDRSRTRSASVVLKAAQRAHGGREGGLAVLAAAPAISYRFTRTVPTAAGSLRAAHTLTRHGAAASLEIDVLVGEGKDSVLGIRDDGRAWLRVEGGPPLDREAAPIRELLQRFSPETTLEPVLGLSEAIATSATWRDLERIGEAETPVIRLRPTQPPGVSRPAGGLVEAGFDAATHQLVSLVWQQGATRTTHTYSGYFEAAPGLTVPRNVRVTQGENVVEELVIDELKPISPPAADRFSPGGG